MSKTLQDLTNDFVDLSSDASGSPFAKRMMNIGIRKFLGLSDWTFSKDSKTISTGTVTQWYDSPYNAQKIEYVDYWYGGVWYHIKECKSGEQWRMINPVETVTSSIPSYWYVSNRTKQIGLSPASTDGNGTIKIGFTKKIRDYAASDYATGSAYAYSGGTTFTAGNSASWGSIMTGRFLQVGSSNTIADGFWFEITNVLSGGSIKVKESIPCNISSGTYKISELVPFPDGWEDLPLWFALEKYYRLRENTVLAREYERMWKEGSDDMLNRDSRSVTGLIEKEEPITIHDINSDPWRMGTIQ